MTPAIGLGIHRSLRKVPVLFGGRQRPLLANRVSPRRSYKANPRPVGPLQAEVSSGPSVNLGLGQEPSQTDIGSEANHLCA